MASVGSGDYQYERVPEWPNMPKYWAFGAASDGAVNSQDEVYIFSRGLHPVTIWDTDGNFISSWGEGTFSANRTAYISHPTTMCGSLTETFTSRPSTRRAAR